MTEPSSYAAILALLEEFARGVVERRHGRKSYGGGSWPGQIMQARWAAAEDDNADLLMLVERLRAHGAVAGASEGDHEDQDRLTEACPALLQDIYEAMRAEGGGAAAALSARLRDWADLFSGPPGRN